MIFTGAEAGFAIRRATCHGDDCETVGTIAGAIIGAGAGTVLGSWLVNRKSNKLIYHAP